VRTTPVKSPALVPTNAPTQPIFIVVTTNYAVVCRLQKDVSGVKIVTTARNTACFANRSVMLV